MKSHTRAEQRHLDRIGEMSCIACELLSMGRTEAQIHHIREGRIARNHFLTIPLCPPHHTGTTASVHMAKPALMRQLGVSSEFDLLALVLEKLA
jgi:hypothetical protein